MANDFGASSTNELFDSFVDSARPVLEDFAEKAVSELSDAAVEGVKDFFADKDNEQPVVTGPDGTIVSRVRVPTRGAIDPSKRLPAEDDSALPLGLTPTSLAIIAGGALLLFIVTR